MLATVVAKMVSASFDLIFMDAAKGQYIRLLPEVLRLLAEGGLLITDNILQEGDVLSSRFAVTRRNRTIHHRMRAYIRALMESPELETLLVPSGISAQWQHSLPTPSRLLPDALVQAVLPVPHPPQPESGWKAKRH